MTDSTVVKDLIDEMVRLDGTDCPFAVGHVALQMRLSFAMLHHIEASHMDKLHEHMAGQTEVVRRMMMTIPYVRDALRDVFSVRRVAPNWMFRATDIQEFEEVLTIDGTFAYMLQDMMQRMPGLRKTKSFYFIEFPVVAVAQTLVLQELGMDDRGVHASVRSILLDEIRRVGIADRDGIFRCVVATVCGLPYNECLAARSLAEFHLPGENPAKNEYHRQLLEARLGTVIMILAGAEKKLASSATRSMLNSLYRGESPGQWLAANKKLSSLFL